MIRRFVFLLCLPLLAQNTERAHQDREILYELQAPETHAFRITHDYTETKAGTGVYLNIVRAGSHVKDPESFDLDTGRSLKWEVVTGAELKRRKLGEAPDDAEVVVTHFEKPVAAGTSVRVRLKETYVDPAGYYEKAGELVWDRTFGRPRNLLALPAGWRLTESHCPGTIQTLGDGRILLTFLNPRNDEIRVLIRARRRT